MAEKVGKEEEEFEFVPVDQPVSEDDEGKDKKDEDEGEEEEDRVPITSEEEDEEASEEEREKIRERRRKERKERKKRREEAIKRDHLELNFLRNRNDDLEKRLTSIEKRGETQESQSLKQQYETAMQEVQTAERIISKAVEAGEGEDVTKAMRYRDEAMNRARQFGYQLNQKSKKTEETQKGQEKTPSAPQVDPEISRRAQSFMKKHSWYDPNNGDEDSSIVMAIDQAVAREGYDPTSDDYWEELEDRMEKRLPSRFTKKSGKGGPRLGSGKEHVPSSSKKEVYISPERKQALIEAGVWEDPKLRQRYIKKYMEYDREHK